MIILLIFVFSNKWSSDEKTAWNTSKSVNNESRWHEVREVEQNVIRHQKVRQWKKLWVSNIWFFIIAVLAWVFARFRIWDIATHLKLLACTAWSFVIYIILWSIFGSKIFRTKLSVLYIFCLILGWIRSIINMFNLSHNINTWNIENNSGSNIETWITVIIDENELLNTWDSDNSVSTWSLLSWDDMSDITWDNNTWTIETWTQDVENTNSETIKYSGNESSLATFTDVVKFLLKDTTLLKDTKVSFKNISKTNVDYPYFRTAFEKKMIGTDIQPNQKPSCETFVVMKWLAEWWNVWTYSNIKQAYWQYASSNGKLPDCKYWNNIKIWEMK